MKRPNYSWVFPVYNESESLPQLVNEIKNAMKGKAYEILAVDDGSVDQSQKVLRVIQKNSPELHILSLGTHEGKWTALGVGIGAARGDIIITIDSDLQDNPTEITKLLDKINGGYDLVSGWRKNRVDQTYKVFISQLGNWCVSFLTGKKFYDLNTPFKAYRSNVIHQIPLPGSLFRFSLLFAQKLGFKVIEIPIVHRPRLWGSSKFGFIKYIRILYDLLLVLLLFSGSGALRNIKKHRL